MTRVLSVLTFITFTWANLAQAIPFPDDTEPFLSQIPLTTSVCTSAVMSLANNEGDPRRAAKAFASVDTLQSVGTSMLAAGLTYSALDALGLATDVTQVADFADHAVHQGVTAGVKMTMDLGIHGKADGVAAGLGVIAGTIGGYLSTKIGQWYRPTLVNASKFLVDL